MGSRIPSLRVDKVCAVFAIVQAMEWLPVLWILMHVFAHGSCPKTSKESALKTDFAAQGITDAVSSMSDPKFSQLSYMPDPMNHEGLTKPEQSTE